MLDILPGHDCRGCHSVINQKLAHHEGFHSTLGPRDAGNGEDSAKGKERWVDGVNFLNDKARGPARGFWLSAVLRGALDRADS